MAQLALKLEARSPYLQWERRPFRCRSADLEDVPAGSSQWQVQIATCSSVMPFST
jgi:hypothetical protein